MRATILRSKLDYTFIIAPDKRRQSGKHPVRHRDDFITNLNLLPRQAVVVHRTSLPFTLTI